MVEFQAVFQSLPPYPDNPAGLPEDWKKKAFGSEEPAGRMVHFTLEEESAIIRTTAAKLATSKQAAPVSFDTEKSTHIRRSWKWSGSAWRRWHCDTELTKSSISTWPWSAKDSMTKKLSHRNWKHGKETDFWKGLDADPIAWPEWKTHMFLNRPWFQAEGEDLGVRLWRRAQSAKGTENKVIETEGKRRWKTAMKARHDNDDCHICPAIHKCQIIPSWKSIAENTWKAWQFQLPLLFPCFKFPQPWTKPTFGIQSLFYLENMFVWS